MFMFDRASTKREKQTFIAYINIIVLQNERKIDWLIKYLNSFIYRCLL
jgi:hypothetical protein